MNDVAVVWDYAAGTGSATVSVPEGGHVLLVDAAGPSLTCQIGSKDTITGAPNVRLRPMGYLAGPVDIQFANSTHYIVAWACNG